MQTVVPALGITLLTIAAIGDVRSRRIPNGLVVGIVVLAAIRIVLVANPVAALHTLAAGAAVFVATFLMFWRGWFGGGDVKLMTGASLLVGYRDVPGFLFVMSVCGALLAIAMLTVDRLGLSGARPFSRRSGSAGAVVKLPANPSMGTPVAGLDPWAFSPRTCSPGTHVVAGPGQRGSKDVDARVEPGQGEFIETDAPRAEPERALNARPTVPYGVAIAAAGAFTLLAQTLVSR